MEAIFSAVTTLTSKRTPGLPVKRTGKSASACQPFAKSREGEVAANPDFPRLARTLLINRSTALIPLLKVSYPGCVCAACKSAYDERARDSGGYAAVFQKQHLRASVLGKHLGQQTEGLGLMRSAGAVVKPWAPHRELAEHGAQRKGVITLLPGRQLRAVRRDHQWRREAGRS
jgi:hypothetical protein